jgi:hypothetical protein
VRQLNNLKVSNIWSAAQPLIIDGAETLQLSPCDILIHICLHSMMMGHTHQITCQDIAASVNRRQPFPWKEFLERVADFRLRTTCYFTFEAVAKENASIIPQDVVKALNPPFFGKNG